MANFLDNLSPEARKAFEQATQKLRDNEVQLKSDSYGPQTPARRAEQTRTTEPKISEPVAEHLGKHQRGGDRIRQAMNQSQQPKAPEPIQAQEKATPAKEPEKER